MPEAYRDVTDGLASPVLALTAPTSALKKMPWHSDERQIPSLIPRVIIALKALKVEHFGQT